MASTKQCLKVSIPPNVVIYTKNSVVAAVVEWLACSLIMREIGVRFHLESKATSSWINVGREWYIESATSSGLSMN